MCNSPWQFCTCLLIPEVLEFLIFITLPVPFASRHNIHFANFSPSLSIPNSKILFNSSRLVLDFLEKFMSSLNYYCQRISFWPIHYKNCTLIINLLIIVYITSQIFLFHEFFLNYPYQSFPFYNRVYILHLFTFFLILIQWTNG